MSNKPSIREYLRTHLRDAVFVHGLPSTETAFDVTILDANTEACDLLGYSRESLQSRLLTDLIGSPLLDTDYFDTLHKDSFAQYETHLTTSKGQPLAVEIDSYAIEAEEGLVCLSVARNVSEMNKLANELKDTKAELKKANEAKQQFMSNISHELRTPLNGILGMTQILMGTELTPAQHEYVSLSQDAARQLNKVMTDLLSLSSVESGNLEVDSSPFAIHPVVDRVTIPLSRQASEKGLSFHVNVAPDIPQRFQGDAGKISQILINILSNAIRFTNQGRILFSVALAGDSPLPGTEMVVFTVSDTGVGIHQDKLTEIFDSFSLAEDYLTKEYGGAGIGLSISRQLAQIMDGDILVESTLGAGSRFSLALPLKALTPTVEQSENKKALKILLAEDEQVNSIMASRLLKEAGHTVTIVGNGQQAIETLSKARFDLVLMDVQMPVVNGVQATRIIRTGGVENVPRDLPIIGLTAYASPANKKQFHEAGMAPIITKPYEADELIRAVASVG